MTVDTLNKSGPSCVPWGMPASKLALVTALALGLGSSAVARAEPEAGRVVLRVKTKHAKGPVRCGLYANKDTWLGKKYAFKATAHVKGRVAECVFENVPAGRYAASAYHDKDDDSKLDQGFMGIPTEDFCFSSGASAGLGPPSFDDAAFDFDGSQLVLPAKM